jgi:hypothetical protein
MFEKILFFKNSSAKSEIFKVSNFALYVCVQPIVVKHLLFIPPFV